MPIQKRFYDERHKGHKNDKIVTYLRCYCSDRNTARIVTENSIKTLSVIDFTPEDLSDLIADLATILNDIKKEVKNG